VPVAPTGRSRIVVATSITRKPIIAVPINSSELWYCDCSSVTDSLTFALIPRTPQAGSVIRWRSSRLTSAPKKITPA